MLGTWGENTVIAYMLRNERVQYSPTNWPIKNVPFTPPCAMRYISFHVVRPLRNVNWSTRIWFYLCFCTTWNICCLLSIKQERRRNITQFRFARISLQYNTVSRERIRYFLILALLLPGCFTFRIWSQVEADCSNKLQFVFCTATRYLLSSKFSDNIVGGFGGRS